MPLFDIRCPSCAWEASDKWERIGEPTRCEVCGAVTEHVWRPHLSKARALVDEWPAGGAWMDNGFPKPRFFETRSAYRKALAANGFEVRGDGEEYHGWIGPDTLAKAADLVTRVTSLPATNREPVEASQPVEMTPREFVQRVREVDAIHARQDR